MTAATRRSVVRERDYVRIANLTTLRIAESILRGLLPLNRKEAARYRRIVRTILEWTAERENSPPLGVRSDV